MRNRHFARRIGTKFAVTAKGTVIKMDLNKALELLRPWGLNQYNEVDMTKLVYDDEVRKMCEANSCGRYGKTWACPPGVGTLAEWKEKIFSHKHAVLFNYIGKLEDSFDFEGMMAAATEFGDIIHGIKAELVADGEDDCLLFGAGGCSLCEKCSYPDEPCRNPDRMVPSVEACGMHVSNTANNCGFKYINGANTVTYFGMLVF